MSIFYLEWRVLDPAFIKRIEQIREKVFKGGVTEGNRALSTMLPLHTLPEERIEILLSLILIALACGTFDEACDYWDEIKELVSKPMPTHVKLYSALFMYADHKRKRALQKFEECLLEVPDNFEFYLVRALAFMDSSQHEHALADLDRANTLSPNNVLVLSATAEVCMELGQTERSIALNEAVLNACPNFRRSLISLGVQYFNSDNPDAAYRLFQILVGNEPLNWFAWTCLGDIRFGQPGRSFQALPFYAAAVIAGSNLGMTYVQLARGCFMLGKFRQGVEVLHRYERKCGKWTSEDIVTVRYLKLIADIIESPSCVKDPGFMTRFQQLKPRNDNATTALFHTLAAVCNLNYNDDILAIFGNHMSTFVTFAHYMQLCDYRVIHPEEALLLGILVRMFVWNGFLLEARAILGLLNRADEPYLRDMCDMIWSEVFAFYDKSKHAGVNLTELHTRLIHSSQANMFFTDMLNGRHRDDADCMPYRDWISEALEQNKNHDLGRLFFLTPSHDLFRQLEAMFVTPELYRTELHAFWKACEIFATDLTMTGSKSAGKPRKKTWLEEKSEEELPETWKECVEEFQKLYHLPASGLDEQDNSLADAEIFKRILSSIREGEKDALEMLERLADNSNTTQECAASMTEALSGFEPMPFTIDGTAFKRCFSAQDNIQRLDTASQNALLGELVSRQYRLFLRKIHDSAIDATQPTFLKEIETTRSEMENLCAILHGNKGFQRSAFASFRINSPDIGPKKLALHIAKSISGHEEMLMFLVRSAEAEAIVTDGWKLPKSPVIATPTYYQEQVVPEVCASMDVLRRMIPVSLFSSVDLVEQFYNYAVYAARQFKQTSDPALFAPFFANDVYAFKTFDASEATQNDMSSQEDERTTTAELKKKPRRGKAKTAESFIKTPEEMAASVTKAFKKLSTRNIARLLEMEQFNDGGMRHPFVGQFMAWAEAQASEMYIELIHLEEMMRNSMRSNAFVIVWKISEILKRFPFLSRLYLLVAGVFDAMGDSDKAINAVQMGLEWEDRLYPEVWCNIHGEEKAEVPLEPIEACTEFEEEQPLLWPERFVFIGNDESMYHYAAMDCGFPMRRRYPPQLPTTLWNTVVHNDKGGAYDFYRLFKKFIPSVPGLRKAWFDGMRTPGVYSLRDYLKHALIQMVEPETFPLRREIAEMLYQLYPDEDFSAIARFYCDNIQSANALPYAAFAYFTHLGDQKDESSQAAVTLGCLLYDVGAMCDAYEILETAVQAPKPSPMAFLTLGCACVEMHEYENAIRYLKEGADIDPDSDRFYYNMSLAYFELGDYENAEQAVKTGIELSAYPIDLNMQLMRIYVHAKRFVDALPLARYVSSQDPDMFMSAILFPEFEAFRELPPVRSMIEECRTHDN